MSATQTIEEQIRELTEELDAMDRDGRFESQRDRYHEIMVQRTDLMHRQRTFRERASA